VRFCKKKIKQIKIEKSDFPGSIKISGWAKLICDKKKEKYPIRPIFAVTF